MKKAPTEAMTIPPIITQKSLAETQRLGTPSGTLAQLTAGNADPYNARAIPTRSKAQPRATPSLMSRDLTARMINSVSSQLTRAPQKSAKKKIRFFNASLRNGIVMSTPSYPEKQAFVAHLIRALE